MSKDIPPAWFVEPLQALAVAVTEHTMVKRAITALWVHQDFGALLGLAPGETMELHTPAGYVTIHSTLEPLPFVVRKP